MNFEKVSMGQWVRDAGPWNHAKHEEIELPTRSTKGSAGYDFKTPVDFVVEPGEVAMVPTGIRWNADDGQVLLIFPRSSIGIKRNIVLANGTGVIDHDYYGADNEGHIWAALYNYGTEPQTFSKGEKIMQGVVVQFCTTSDDTANVVRSGGIGSTGE